MNNLDVGESQVGRLTWDFLFTSEKNSSESALRVSVKKALTDANTNRVGRRTEERCCQITKAILTVNMKSNQRGQSKTSSDAGNDQIAIMSNGNPVSPFNELVYSPPPAWSFNLNQPATKSWPLTKPLWTRLTLSVASVLVSGTTRALNQQLSNFGDAA